MAMNTPIADRVGSVRSPARYARSGSAALVALLATWAAVASAAPALASSRPAVSAAFRPVAPASFRSGDAAFLDVASVTPKGRRGVPSGILRQSLETPGTEADAAPLRSPRLSFVLSAILPGAGQLYNSSQRGYVFLALEAASWFARSSYLDAADRKEDDSRAFADRHWDFDRFLAAESAEGCGFPPGADTLLAGYFAADRDQYYEELANGDEYRCGWDDAFFDTGDETVVSARRADYRDQRDKANSFENRAGLALGVLVLNRIVSAVDAFRLARGRHEGAAPSLRMTSELGRDAGAPRAVFRLTKEFP